jgi:hypothetical protein
MRLKIEVMERERKNLEFEGEVNKALGRKKEERTICQIVCVCH